MEGGRWLGEGPGGEKVSWSLAQPAMQNKKGELRSKAAYTEGLVLR